MKAKEVMRYLVNLFKTSNHKHRLIGLYIMAAMAVILSFVLGIQIYPDSGGYLAIGQDYINLQINFIRTPVYPLLCWLMQAVSGPYALYAISVVQILFYLISVWMFYKISDMLIQSKTIAYVISLIYVVHPSIFAWTTTVLTESLAISLSVMLLYLVLFFAKNQKWIHILYMVILSVIMLLLRPSFIFIIPLLLVYFLYYLIKDNKIIYVWGLVGVLFISASYIGYSYLYKIKYQVFTTSCVGTMNQYWILRINHMIDVKNIEDKNMQDDITKFQTKDIDKCNFCSEFYELSEKYGFITIDNYVKSVISKNKISYAKIVSKSIYKNKGKNVMSYPKTCNALFCSFIKLFTYIINISFNILFILVILYFLYIVHFIIKKRNIPIVLFFLWAWVCANIVIAFIGSPGAYNRLMAAAYPVIFIMVAQIIDRIQIKIKSFSAQIMY